MEHINKEMLELFFEKEQRAGGGKVKFIDIDNKNKCVFVDFEEKSGTISISMFIMISFDNKSQIYRVYISIINCIK
jgi:hypothetical protein